MTRKRWLKAGLALLLGGGLAGAIPGLAAVGQSSPPSSPVILRSSARILDKGAVAKPSAYVVCQPGDLAQLNITLTEAVGKRGLASGNGFSQSFPCTGQIETITVAVVASLPGKPFVAGRAFGQASLFDFSNGTEASTSRTVTLTTK
jgi:hypothetical protein